MLGFYAAESQPDAVVAEFKYCKSHMQRSLVERQIIDDLFSYSRLIYRHPVSEVSEQKTHFMWYGDAPRKNITPEIQMEGFQCSSTRETSVRHKLPRARLSLKMSCFRRSNAFVTSVSFHVPMSKQSFQTEQEGCLVMQTLILKNWKVIRNWQQISLSSKLDKILNGESFNILY